MHRVSWLPIIIILAVVVGGLLYLYGGPSFHKDYLASPAPSPVSVPQTQSNLTIIAKGDTAPITDRVNYRITTSDQFAQLWQEIYSNNGQPLPNIDFTSYEVLALFDGSHSTNGYGIALTSLQDSDGQRTVTITHIVPGDTCAPASGITSPFILVQVPKSSLPIDRVEETYTTPC